MAADVADETQLRAAVETVRERFGALNGVIHAAGAPASGLLALKTRAEAERVLRPKVGGALALERALADQPLDFLVHFSSATVALGGLGESDYAAANAFLDAHAHAARRRGLPVTAVDWGPWRWDAWTPDSAAESHPPGHARTSRDLRRGRFRPAHPHPGRRDPPGPGRPAGPGQLSRPGGPSSGETWCRHPRRHAVIPGRSCARRTSRPEPSWNGGSRRSGAGTWAWTASASTTRSSSWAAPRWSASRSWPRWSANSVSGSVPRISLRHRRQERSRPWSTRDNTATRRRKWPVRRPTAPGEETSGANRPGRRPQPPRSAGRDADGNEPEETHDGDRSRHPRPGGHHRHGRPLSRRGRRRAAVAQSLRGDRVHHPVHRRGAARGRRRGRTTWPNPRYVRAGAVLDGIELFDAGFFGIPPREAELLDPQQRLFLESAWAALEAAGCDPSGTRLGRRVRRLRAEHATCCTTSCGNADVRAWASPLQVVLGNDKDSLATTTAYKLDLRGPGFNVQTPARRRWSRSHRLHRACWPASATWRWPAASAVSVPQRVGLPLPGGRHRLARRPLPGVRRRGAGRSAAAAAWAWSCSSGWTTRSPTATTSTPSSGARRSTTTAPEGRLHRAQRRRPGAVISEALANAGVDAATIELRRGARHRHGAGRRRRGRRAQPGVRRGRPAAAGDGAGLGQDQPRPPGPRPRA